MRRALVVTSCRKRPQYLQATLAGMEAEGARAWKAGERFVAFNADGCPSLGERELHWDLIRLPGIGGTSVYRELMRWCEREGIDALTVFEDDVVFAPGALWRMGAARVPAGAAGIAWFDMGESTLRTATGWLRVPCSGCVRDEWWGTQAFTFERATIEFLARAEWDKTRLGWGPRTAQDVVMGELLRGREWAIHVPNLVQHVGAVSAWQGHTEMPDAKLSRSFTGAPVDALWSL